MTRFNDKDFSELAMIGFFMESHRDPNASTIECAKRGAGIAEELIRRDAIEELTEDVTDGTHNQKI